MNKLLTLVDKGVNKGYFRWLWFIGATSWWTGMVLIANSWTPEQEHLKWTAEFLAFMILPPFLVKWIGQWIYKAVRKKKEKAK